MRTWDASLRNSSFILHPQVWLACLFFGFGFMISSFGDQPKVMSLPSILLKGLASGLEGTQRWSLSPEREEVERTETAAGRPPRHGLRVRLTSATGGNMAFCPPQASRRPARSLSFQKTRPSPTLKTPLTPNQSFPTVSSLRPSSRSQYNIINTLAPA